MGCFRTLGDQYILEGRIPGCERFGRVWAVPEDAVKTEAAYNGREDKEIFFCSE